MYTEAKNLKAGDHVAELGEVKYLEFGYTSNEIIYAHFPGGLIKSYLHDDLVKITNRSLSVS